jgi:hypothetical protein
MKGADASTGVCRSVVSNVSQSFRISKNSSMRPNRVPCLLA